MTHHPSFALRSCEIVPNISIDPSLQFQDNGMQSIRKDLNNLWHQGSAHVGGTLAMNLS